METLDNDPIYSRAKSDYEATLARARDLEGFLRVYAEYKGTAFTMPAGGAAPVQPRPAVPAPPRADRPPISLADRSLSISEGAEKVLRQIGRPMKARAIAETMLDWDYPYEGTVHELRASVGGVLAREVREGGVFTKVATGTFGLKEWLTETGNIQGEEDGDAPDVEEEREEETALEHAGSLFEEATAGLRPTEEVMS